MIKLFLSLLLLSLNAFAAKEEKPYKIVVLTDPEAVTRATEFKDYLLKKPPFDEMGDKLVIEVSQMTAEDMGCKNSDPNAPRIITCNTKKLIQEQHKAEANLALAFTSKGSGGAGGAIPIASLDYPVATMFHEMLHTYGLLDEYDYSASERTVYCKKPRESDNIVYFQDTPPYIDDAAARAKHTKDVPWMFQIPTSFLITHGKDLGSTVTAEARQKGSQIVGLFRGGSCDSVSLPGWRPYANSIMRAFEDDTIYPLYEQSILDQIRGTMGRRSVKAPPPPNADPCDLNRNEGTLLESNILDVLKRLKSQSRQ